MVRVNGTDYFAMGTTHYPVCPACRIKSTTADTTSEGERNENPGRTVTTISLSAGKSFLCKRKASRIIRLIRFRSTALPVFLRTLIPNRFRPAVLGAKIKEKPCPCNRFPCLYTLLNSWFFRNRQLLGSRNCPIAVKQTAVYDLLPDGVLK